MAKTTDEVKKKRPRSSGSEGSGRSNKEDGKLFEEAPASVLQDRASQLRSKESPLMKKFRTDEEILGKTPEMTEKSEDRSLKVLTLHDSTASNMKPQSSPGVEDLRTYVESLGGVLEDGWQVESHRSGGKLTKTFISPINERFRSRVKVAKHMGLPANLSKKEEMYLSSEIAPLQMDNDKVEQQDVGIDGHVTLSPRSKKGGKSKLHEHSSAELSGQRKQQHSSKFPSSQEEAVINMNLGPILASNAMKAIVDVQKTPASSVVTERCQDTLRSIISTESFASLNNILNRGSPSGSIDSPLQMKAHPRSIDLQLIQLRLSNGVYGLDPHLFFSDVRKVWDNIIAVGKEQVALAQSLSDISAKLYQQQIMSLFQGSASKEVSEGKEQVTSQQGKQAIDDSVLSLNDSHVLQGNAPERSTDMQVSAPGQEQKPITQLYTSKRRARKSTKHNKPLLLKVKVADKKISGVCKSCGLEQGMDCMICRLCNAAFHSQCLGILPANLQEDEWCCPSCAVNEKEINEKLALRSDETPKELHKTTGKMGVCEACKKQDDNVLRCDGCEAAYHVNCIIPATVIFPDDSWYCPKCAEDHRSPLKDVHEKDSPSELSQGHNCSVCTRVPKVSPLPADIPQHPSPVPGGEAAEKSVEPAAAVEVNVPGSPAASTDMEPPEPRFLLGNENVCKACGAECTKLKSKASCSFCLNRFHLSCLRPPLKKAPRNTWYCPSCLCRVCKIDADDDKILLCDTCDDGYHTYCLNPPVEERPKGAWFCPSCAKSDVPNSPSPKQSEVSKRKRKSTEPRRST